MAAFRRLSQESQAPLHASENPGRSADSPPRNGVSRSSGGCEYVELENMAFGPPIKHEDKKRAPGAFCSHPPSDPPHALPGYAELIRQRVVWWSWHSAWSMYAFFVAGVAFAVWHHLYYSSLDGKPAKDQTEKLRYGTFMAFLTKACLIWAVASALRQRIWTTLQSKSLSLQGVDSVFAIADDPMAILDWKTTLNAKVAILMAMIAWLGPVMVILASQAMSVEPTIDQALCPGITTLNFSLESVEEWRKATKIDGVLSNALTLGFKLDQACGPDWDCRYTIKFTGPGYKCEIASVGRDNKLRGSRHMVAPFGPEIIIPKGNFSYYVHATEGEYGAEQMSSVASGGMPWTAKGDLMEPPFPRNLGAFRTEPVIWVGHSSTIGSGKATNIRSEPGWDDYHLPTFFSCELFETEYTVEFEHSRGVQLTSVLDREYLAPIVDTTYARNTPAMDGTNDNITAFPESNYVYPEDVSWYRYVAAFHSLGRVFRDVINGTMDATIPMYPIVNTGAYQTKLMDPRNYFFPVPNLMEAMRSMFEDILLSMFNYPEFLVVAWAADPSRVAGEREGDKTTMYPCTKSKPENRLRYHPIELAVVYGVSIILAAAAIGVGTVSVIRNGGVLKNTRFSSIATLLQHCGTSFQDEGLWRRYLDYIRQAVTEASENDGEGQVAACATFHVKERQPSDSSSSLEGLQPSEVRKCHMEWIASLKAKDPDAYYQISQARRDFFLLVNDDVLDKFRATEESGFHGGCGVPSYHTNDGVVIVVCEAEEDDERPYDDGPEGDMEWQYLDAFSITAMYESLCGSTEAYYEFFEWPPEGVWDNAF
ncbi:hypothetical protein PG993_004186 [Apiospora rasikravindrae]|uniref:Uncharacterized protein n=1 Tax=Apiospora rasikravindrae TaxID=990691 RepID=A0ABR1TC27_9PEZI